MKTFILLTLFVLCAVAHTVRAASSEESSSSEEVVNTRKKPIARVAHDSESSKSSEEVVHYRSRVNGGKQSSKKAKTPKKSNYQRPDHDTRWDKFKLQYKLSYPNAKEEKKAKAQFIKNREKVLEHKDDEQDNTINKEVNKFATMSRSEFRKSKMSLTPETRPEVRSYFSQDMTRQSVPVSYDSRTIPGAVSMVRAQGDCGGCWAFSTVATLETTFYVKYNKTYKFSEQHLIDCDGFNDGCDGGTMDAAFNYIKRYEGINALKMYPYEDGRKRCRAQTSYNRPVFISEVKGFPKPSKNVTATVVEDMMKVACATYGAVAIGIDAEFMQFYGGGVYTGPCSIGVNHGVVLVGYGTDENTGLDFWIIKNSWGPDWGEAGYLRLKRGYNTCGVGQMASVPIIANNIDLSHVPSDDQVGN